MVQAKDFAIERVQKIFTRLLLSLEEFSYGKSLDRLGLFSLE